MRPSCPRTSGKQGRVLFRCPDGTVEVRLGSDSVFRDSLRFFGLGDYGQEQTFAKTAQISQEPPFKMPRPMRKFLKLFLLSAGGVVSLGVLLVLAALIIFPSNEVENEFATYTAAAASDAFKLQRLPTALPKSATKIWSVRNLDLNYEVVTFHYGPDFDKFIASQARAPVRTAKSLGIQLRDDRFANPQELIYMPRVTMYEESRPGTLLINHVHRVALYFD